MGVRNTLYINDIDSQYSQNILYRIEHIKKAKKKLDELEKRGKDKTKRITEKVSEQKRVLDDESHWRKDILEGRKKKNQGRSSESGQQV